MLGRHRRNRVDRSDVDLLSYLDRVVDLDAPVANGAFDLSIETNDDALVTATRTDLTVAIGWILPWLGYRATILTLSGHHAAAL